MKVPFVSLTTLANINHAKKKRGHCNCFYFQKTWTTHVPSIYNNCHIICIVLVWKEKKREALEENVSIVLGTTLLLPEKSINMLLQRWMCELIGAVLWSNCLLADEFWFECVVSVFSPLTKWQIWRLQSTLFYLSYFFSVIQGVINTMT